MHTTGWTTFAVCVGAATMSAQSLTWNLTYVEQAPSPRCCSGMAYDAYTGTVVFFGGLDSDNSGLSGHRAVSPAYHACLRRRKQAGRTLRRR
jgi:hypothetical protein